MTRADDLASVLASSLATPGVSVIDVPIDYLGSSLEAATRASDAAPARVSSAFPQEVSP